MKWGSASSQATSVESKSGYVTVVVAAAGSRTDSLVQTQRTPGRCDSVRELVVRSKDPKDPKDPNAEAV